MPQPQPAIDPQRIAARLAAVNHFGTVPGEPGVHRLSFSSADMAARRWLIDELRDLGLAAGMDAVGNVIGRWEAKPEAAARPAVLLGSHLDSVPRGGPLDGALGVIAALECVQALREAGIRPAAPIEVIATSEEEGRFGGMLGAQAMAGLVDAAWFDSAVDDAGQPLREALRGAGFDPADYPSARRDPAEVAAFLELHIEQGPVLDRAGAQVGIVEGISGVFNWAVSLRGEANHAGTTPMELRRDAFRGLADFAAAIPQLIAAAGTPASRLTVGQVELHPNFAHTVPGGCDFTLIGRDMDEAVMRALAAVCRERLRGAAEAHGLQLSLHEAGWLAPTPCDPEIIASFTRQAEALGLRTLRMPSGAGHDTQMMARLTRAGMIFVPSAGGISHAPEEHTDAADIEAGCKLLLHTLLQLAGPQTTG